MAPAILLSLHLRRDFTAIAERDDEESKAIGKQLLEETNTVFELYHKVRDGTLEHHRLRAEIESTRHRIKELLEQGGRTENQKTAGTCQQILKHYRSLWTFVRVKEVEPTNNRASASTQTSGVVAPEIVWNTKPRRQSICRSNLNCCHNPAAATPRCARVSARSLPGE